MTAPRPLSPGDHLKDNDPRMSHRAPVEVVSVTDETVIVRLTTRNQTLLRRRVFTDGKPRRYGWSRVQP